MGPRVWQTTAKKWDLLKAIWKRREESGHEAPIGNEFAPVIPEAVLNATISSTAVGLPVDGMKIATEWYAQTSCGILLEAPWQPDGQDPQALQERMISSSSRLYPMVFSQLLPSRLSLSGSWFLPFHRESLSVTGTLSPPRVLDIIYKLISHTIAFVLSSRV